MPSIDIIVPVFNEQDVIPLFEKRITQVMQSCDVQWRVLFIDDGSSDDSLAMMKSIHQSNSQFGYLSLSHQKGPFHRISVHLEYP